MAERTRFPLLKGATAASFVSVLTIMAGPARTAAADPLTRGAPGNGISAALGEALQPESLPPRHPRAGVPDPSGYPWPDTPSDTRIDDGHGYYAGECVSFVAWMIRAEHRPLARPADFLGDANRWTGASSSATPHVGDVAQWYAGRSGADDYGHVAFVSAVDDKADTAEVVEYNWLDAYDGYTGRRLSVRTIPWDEPSRYLQF